MTDGVVVQKLGLMRSNDFIVASNTSHSKHEHGAWLLHRGVGLLVLNAEDLARDGLSCVTTSLSPITLA
jgi:hypothetical protein